MDEKLNIRLTLCDRTYPMFVTRHEEETVRKAAKQINEFYLKYQTTFPGRDTQDYMAMAALHFSKENIQVKSDLRDTNLAVSLLSVEKQLDGILEQS